MSGSQSGSARRVRFRLWVHNFGVSRLARELGTHRTVVHGWLHPTNPHMPRLNHAERILTMSRQHNESVGRLFWNDIYGNVSDHQDELKKNRD